MPRFAARFLSLLLGIVLSVIIFELLLKLASAGLHATGYRADTLEHEGGRVVLCVGDSYTYGTSVSHSGTYPAQLEEHLNRYDPGGRYRVVNQGVPGMNSAQAVAALPIWLDELDPDAVVVWIGANNWFNRTGSDGELPSREEDGLASRLIKRSRLLRLVQMIRIDAGWRDAVDDSNALHQQIFEQGLLSFHNMQPRSSSEFLEVTNRDFIELGDMISGRRIPWLLVTYPTRTDPGANPFSLQWEAAHAYSIRSSIPLVDTSTDLSRALAENPGANVVCSPKTREIQPCMLVNEMGPHPTELLYRYIADSIALALVRQLDGAPELDRRPQTSG